MSPINAEAEQRNGLNLKIVSENKAYSPDEARQLMQNAIDSLNQRIGDEAYTMNNNQIVVDAYGIETIKLNIKYLGLHLTTIEACLKPNEDGLRRGVDLDSENIAVLLAASTIQLKGGLAKDGYLLNKKAF